MNLTKLYFTLFFILLGKGLFAQTATVSGKVNDEQRQGLYAVTIFLKGSGKGTTTDEAGRYTLQVPADKDVVLVYRFVGYTGQEKKMRLASGEKKVLNIDMELATKLLKGVEVQGENEAAREQISIMTLEPKAAKALPTPFGEFNKILSTLPGVASNNELSSAYSVRGGNFDENLVYVNDIQVYRPFLVTAGQQEGLSFVNTDLVDNVAFSAGGWQPKYGDKLSSTLNVYYKEPEEFGGSVTLGLLGGAAHLEGASKDKSVSYILGVRHKSAQYLLNTLETQGEYLPRFTDVQGYVHKTFGKRLKDGSQATSLGLLTSYARNRYLVRPENRESEFGTFNVALRLIVGFDGQEILEYDTYQAGLKLEHQFDTRLRTKVILSGVSTEEKEYQDLEGGYRLCDVDKDPNSTTFDACLTTRGIGTEYDYSRNKLQANIINFENRWELDTKEDGRLEFGLGYSLRDIDDELDEYSFLDSADFVTRFSALRTDTELDVHEASAFVQYTHRTRKGTLTYGIRSNYNSLNDQLLFSPRVQYSFKPQWQRDVLFKAAIGLYQQPPFYRELRGFDGEVNPDLKAQQSLHVIGGLDYNLSIWERPFKFLAEVYHKRLWDVVAYDVDNVRLRYYANNDTKAFVTGLDMRFSGEFIPGTESWFSLGILSTQEDVENDGMGYIRRPTDQRVNLGVFFQDHIPNDPSIRVSINLLYGTGLPFGPPSGLAFRNSFRGPAYRRLDVGFTKQFYLNQSEGQDNERSLLLGIELLNLLGASNTISYNWVSDVVGQQFAVPNTLSARFLNAKLLVRF